MDDAGIPTDGPETTLGQVARRLKLRYSRTYVARAVASHRQPSSLLALVEVGRGLGIEVTAGRAEPPSLETIAYPAVVHFGGVEGGGFGVLEGVTATGFKVWDSHNGLHEIERAKFLRFWSGIVALCARRDAPGARETGYLRNRVTEVVFGSFDPPAVVGDKTAPFLRALLGVLVAVLVVVGIARLPNADRAAAVAIALLSSAGLGVTIVAGVSIASQDGTLSDRVCARGKLIDCHSVLSSRYARVFGIPLTDVGIAFFGSILLLLATGAVTRPGSTWAVIPLLYLASVPVSITLIGVQAAMRQLCTLCLAVHVVNIAAAAISWTWLRPAAWSAGRIVPSLVLVALYGLLLLFLAIPYFRKHQGLRVLAGMRRRIAASPFASLAEILTAEPIDVAPDACAVEVARGPDAHELVVLVHPSCGKCDLALQQIRAVARAGLVSVHVGLAPKDRDEDDARACSAVVAAGLTQPGERVVDAYSVAKSNLRSMLEDDPIAVVASGLSLEPDAVAARMDVARGRATVAEELVDEHAEGTPAFFFDRRLYRGDLGHLVFLLESRRDLLAPALGNAPVDVEPAQSS